LRWAAAGLGGLLAAALAGCEPPVARRRPTAGPAPRPSPTPTGRPGGRASPSPSAGTRVPATATPPASPAPATATPVPQPPEPTAEPTARTLPRWHGFNLLEKFNADWGNRRFQESDFAWIAEFGFNFVRLPMDYRCWAEPHDWAALRQGVLEEIDDALRYGERYQVHVCLNFHRAPGYSVTPPPEAKSLWTDEEAQRVCTSHWAYFAKRYRGLPSSRLSFNLFNEPPPLNPQVHRAVVARVLEAIRKEDAQRLVICDGLDWGRTPPTELIGSNVAAATRGYDPIRLTHYRAEWVDGADQWEPPTYPLRDGATVWGRDTLQERRIQPWKWLEARGMGVIVGEFGAYNRTPHKVVLEWMRESLQLWREAGWGWALWNFRGPFGLLDSDRPDVAYETWRGHKLDRAMLDLLRTTR
jgi:endoglucanase